MNELRRTLLLRVIMHVVRLIFRLPAPLLRLLAVRRIAVEGRSPLLSARVLIRISRFAPFDSPHNNGELAKARRELDQAGVLAGALVHPEVVTAEHGFEGPGGFLRLRLYRPPNTREAGPGLVYFHGGGFVVGSIETHDAPCRLLAAEAGVRVVSVEYRLAPEHPFPAAADDAVAAFRHVHRQAAEFGIIPERLAVGGDSSGGNLAAIVAHAAARGQVPRPVFALLLNPATDARGDTASHRLFADGFRLDRDEWLWYREQYLRDPAERTDPRASVVLDEALAGYPPAYVATCEFDPLRDEGEAYAARLARAGVPVVHRRHDGQLHGFPNRLGFDRDGRVAMQQAAGVLRAAMSSAQTTDAA